MRYSILVVCCSIRCALAVSSPLQAQTRNGGYFEDRTLYRVEGVTIYFLALCVTFLAARCALLKKRSGASGISDVVQA